LFISLRNRALFEIFFNFIRVHLFIVNYIVLKIKRFKFDLILIIFFIYSKLRWFIWLHLKYEKKILNKIKLQHSFRFRSVNVNMILQNFKTVHLVHDERCSPTFPTVSELFMPVSEFSGLSLNIRIAFRHVHANSQEWWAFVTLSDQERLGTFEPERLASNRVSIWL